ncbi:collagen alpha-1(I) chain [Panthera pardus]|uniref:Collagen alpha-1(I) chain n=1 Tax=Panthera pardus TaxID=9691 RepID=A0A9W2W5F9_PANPR|nr:collagen alpha-1(I) chain [Panthera pardus]
MASVRDLHMEKGSRGASPRLKPQRSGDPGHRETSRKRSERSVQTCARVCQGPGRGSWVRGARSPAGAPPTPTCAAARRPARCGRPREARYSFRVLPRTAGPHTHRTASSVAETFPPELPSGFWLAPGSPEPGPCRPFAADAPGPARRRGAHLPGAGRAGRGRRSRAGFVSGAVLAGGGQSARHRSSAGRGAGRAGGLRLRLRAPAPARLGARGLAVERRAPHRPRGLRAASAAPPGQGRLGAGGQGGEAVPRARGKSPRPKVLRPAHTRRAGLPGRVRVRWGAERQTPGPRPPSRHGGHAHSAAGSRPAPGRGREIPPAAADVTVTGNEGPAEAAHPLGTEGEPRAARIPAGGQEGGNDFPVFVESRSGSRGEIQGDPSFLLNCWSMPILKKRKRVSGSRVDPKTSINGITWELVRNANCQDPPQPS